MEGNANDKRVTAEGSSSSQQVPNTDDGETRTLTEARSWGGEASTTTARESSRQTSGENTSSQDEDSNRQRRRQHQKTQSWSGVIAGFAQDVFGGGTNTTNNNRPPLPLPPPVQRRHSAEREYHLKNQKFLQQAVARACASSPSSINSHKQHFASPSPNTKFRKRLQLKAIDEDDGQSLIILDGSNHNNYQANRRSAPSTVSMTDTHNNSHQDDWTTTSIKFQENDDSSVISSLAGSYVGLGGSGAAFGNAGHNRMTTSSVRTTESEWLPRFEKEQDEQFQQQKQDIERKLSNVLHQNLSTQDATTSDELVKSYVEELERERAAMLAQWKSAMIMEEERIRQEESRRRLLNDCYEALFKPCVDSIMSSLATAEVVLSNMPLTIGAVGLSWVTMGVIWFKFTEEMISACQHVHYFSKQCEFREFPGCFQCDTSDPYYQIALKFHFLCSAVAATSCVLFLLKVILAPNIVIEMLKNPTTSTPIGVWCIAMVCTFAGQHGAFGETIVLVTSCFHVLLAFWFMFTVVFKYRAWVDPGWFPNVVGIAYAAVKTWIYFPTPGLILMALCTIFFLGTFFVSVIRVYLNHKIAAPVCWIQLSAPSITLYALTLISQPTRHEESLFEISNEAKEQYQHFLITYFLPLQHIFMLLTMVGLISAVHSLWVRWPTFKTKPFSPAHVAFCFPTLSHTNAIQAYRASLNAYSTIPPGSIFKKLLFGYWCLFLFFGTILNIVFTIKYVVRIPEWTKPDLTEEEEPPCPDNTIVHEMMNETGAHETIRQPFVSPSVLEANEAGVLIRVKRGTEDYRIHGPFVRTRKISSLGFDPVLSEMELREERARLLDWVAKNAPRKRNRTLSMPGIFNLRGHDGRDVYGTFSDLSQAETLVRGHARSKTATGAIV